MANGTKELNTSPITIEDEINEFSEKPVQGKTLYKKLKELEDGIAYYPYEAVTLFEGNVEYADGGDIETLTLPIGKPLRITINGVVTDLFWIEEEGLWSDVYPFIEANVNIVLFSDPEEDYTRLYIKDAPDGTYAVKIEGEGIQETFENAVEEIVDAKKELPAIASGDAGKVLKVNSGESGVEWGEVGGGQSGGKSGISVSLYVTNGIIENVYINNEESTLEDLFDYGWENVSSIYISDGITNLGGAFLLMGIQDAISTVRVNFGILTIPAVIPDSNGYAYIEYVTVESSGSYTAAYNGSITIRKLS